MYAPSRMRTIPVPKRNPRSPLLSLVPIDIDVAHHHCSVCPSSAKVDVVVALCINLKGAIQSSNGSWGEKLVSMQVLPVRVVSVTVTDGCTTQSTLQKLVVLGDAYPTPWPSVFFGHAYEMPPPQPTILFVVPPPSQPTRTPTIVGGILFGSIFILLIAGCLYYAHMLPGVARSAPNAGRRGDFFHNLRGLRLAFVGEPTASSRPSNVRTDDILRSFNFRSRARDLYPLNTRAHLAVPPPYEYPPSYEASVSDHTGSSHSPISPSTPGLAPWERSTTNHHIRDRVP